MSVISEELYSRASRHKGFLQGSDGSSELHQSVTVPIRDGESQILEVGEHLIIVDEYAVAECLYDVCRLLGPLEKALGLQEKVSLPAGCSAPAPFVGDEDSE
ncbi:hypothetical protein CVIRNUC_004170 [Coccomyxa viridis]|uniref:Uncharacterized protein n=1 Tax=Coccomyxa viridis TaxID=1274662 RepID=A0AAV1I4G3_9CHLO|nr:hypothetical protein CVIRNUC_004170 [Coccomyxa viridis]